MKVIAIIPARGGSKGVPHKNLIELGGKSLIQHAVDCALDSSLVDKVVLTSDSEIILENVKRSPKLEKIKRPESLATDKSSVTTAVLHVLDKFSDFDLVILLQPTSPLRTTKDLDSIIGEFNKEVNLDGVISTVPLVDMHPARMYNVSKDSWMQPYEKGGETLRRQDLEPVYYRNGCFYAVRTAAFLKENTFMVANKKAYIMDAKWLANIDDERDVLLTKYLYDLWLKENC
ncbi:N-Acetylneuraminate cytidylyltransferase [Winogradskyella psychrotolerans RS-3]|uniref:N-Acetylneuraminate cytidylyltransferase n=1 Tax=Winogradskyella psychrotolerans RS-3 TaxID=641526 RepID=S7VZ52_9FLAO|nr:acylneuraminate cytidylyltransferase family protein [Winogradskyella psychrotolerans]EPR74692.1 N-Acetylneuraminate cytidylyltransferase [Winogradskyella psychrotolerans RS-3]